MNIGGIPPASGRASGLRRSRRRRCSTGCSGVAARPRGPGPEGPRTGGPLLPRTPSRSDSTCSVAGSPEIALAGTGGSARWPMSGARSRGVLPGRQSGLVEQLPESLFDTPPAAFLGKSAGFRSRNDHEVVSGSQVIGRGPEGVPEQSLDAVALHGAADLAPHRYAEPWRPLV